jgi:hypothetical protein
MSKYCYLVNRKEKIFVEAYKLTRGGEPILEEENSNNVILFLEYCRNKGLDIKCVIKHWLVNQGKYYQEFRGVK